MQAACIHLVNGKPPCFDRFLKPPIYFEHTLETNNNGGLQVGHVMNSIRGCKDLLRWTLEFPMKEATEHTNSLWFGDHEPKSTAAQGRCNVLPDSPMVFPCECY